MSSPASALPMAGTCFVDATQALLHRQFPSHMRAPVLGLNDWRVAAPTNDKMMERRGWIQPLCSTVTTPEHIRELPRSCERIFIPGEFCRQGDVLSAAATSGRLILLERGAFLAPSDLTRAVEKLGEARERLILVEAGSSFGYSDRILDPRALEVILQLGCPLTVNLDALSKPTGSAYAHRPQWLNDAAFDLAVVRTALAFKANYLILPSNREIHPEATELWLSSKKETP